MRHKTQIYTIYGQCEEAAAETLIAEAVATKIALNLVPRDQLTNELGQSAKFAVVVPADQVARFEQLCKDLRA